MENTESTRTVQQYRHEARANLTTARAALALRTPETGEVYHLLNGQISSVLAGQVGFSQEEQVARLTEAKDKVEAGLAALPEKVAAARESILAQIDGWERTITDEANKAIAVLEEARTFAAERDFEAWQEQKRQRRGGYTPSEDFNEEEGDEEV